MTQYVLVSLCPLMALVGVTAVLAYRFRRLSRTRYCINLLFPVSQMCLVVFILYYVNTYNLPSWMLGATVAVGLLCSAADLILFKALGAAEEKALAEAKVRLFEELIAEQQRSNDRFLSEEEEAEHIREDIITELKAVDFQIAQGDCGQTSRMIYQAVGLADALQRRYCAHRFIDALISMKAKACDAAGIRATFELDVPDDLLLPSVELCAVFSNLLDNAFHACLEVSESDRFITTKAYVSSGFLLVDVRNSCSIVVSQAKKQKRSMRRAKSATDEHGWGLSILQGIAERHGGDFETEQGEGVFRSTILLKV